MSSADRKKQLEATYKAKDTEEWLDIKFTRPAGYWWAVQCERLGLHPNTVTLISMVIGAFAGYCFYYESMAWTVLGILMLVWADILDSADGQLARMTGKKTKIGRLLDGFAGDVWFFCIYFFISLRLTSQPMPFGLPCNWGIWIWILCAFSGFVLHSRQACLADYYRNIYMYYLSGNSELTDSEKILEEKKTIPWGRGWLLKVALFFYGHYTMRQERYTPEFQRMRSILNAKYGENIPATIRETLCRQMYPLLKWANISTFNTRAIVLYVSMLCGCPWAYIVFEMTVMSAICFNMRHTHESICRSMAERES